MKSWKASRSKYPMKTKAITLHISRKVAQFLSQVALKPSVMRDSQSSVLPLLNSRNMTTSRNIHSQKIILCPRKFLWLVKDMLIGDPYLIMKKSTTLKR